MKAHKINQAAAALAEEIQIGKDYDPYIEGIFIRHYAKKLGATGVKVGQHEIGKNIVDNGDYTIMPREKMVLSVTIFFDGIIKTTKIPDSLYLAYWDVKEKSPALMITDPDDNMLYLRNAGQNPKTEWVLNELAGDATDENGRIIFPSDPYNI